MNKKKRVLVACEESGTVRDAFRKLGHDAWSCDIEPCSGDPEFHIQDDVLNVLNQGWDLMIAHPPCTYLSVSGLHWNKRIEGRAAKTDEALDFVQKLMDAPIDEIALENPISCISTRIRKPEQIVQPYHFGDDASKSTCLWLKNLPPLKHTEYIEGKFYCCGSELIDDVPCEICHGEKSSKMIWANQTPSGQNKLGPSPERAKLRSKTYQGIADAMALQWGGECKNGKT